MDKENSNRKRRESDSHRDRESCKEHHHRSKHDDDRRRSDEHHRRRSDSRTDREGSRDRDSRRERERSHSVERKKRKERDESEERSDKRTRVYEENGREKSRFEDVKVKDDDRERKEGEGFGSEGKSVKKDAKYESRDSGHQSKAGSVANSLATGPVSTPSSISPETFVAHTSSPATKVSSISKTNENKGVNINRSHEVPGKSSTDGTASDAGKTGGLSLDALAKAKRALQMQKELAERMKKIPSLNRDAGSTREGSPQVGEKEVAKLSSSGKGIMPVPQVTASLTGTSGVTSSAPTLPIVTSAPTIPPQSGMPHLPGLTAQKYEAVKRAQELAAKMGFRQDPEFAPLINMFPGQMAPDVTIQPKPSKAPVLRLDALGREIDEHGNVVNVPKVNSLSTLKVNINKQKKDAFQILKPELDVDPDQNPHFDARMGIDKNKLLRPKRMTFQFVEEGKWSREAEVIKLKSQFGEAKAKELKAKQAQLAKAKAEPDINPNLIEVGERVITKEKPKESIPDVEWWDVPFLQSGTYGDIVDGNIHEEIIKMEKITIYVEHPRPIEPPAEPAPPPPQPLKLTKKEQKKLRTQRRLAREKDRQEMIRLGVLEPPKPKVKMSNLMKVLGSEATQDPTKLEMEIRSAAAEREQAHIDRNIARKLTPAERREKKERKLFDDPNALDTIVSVYKINDLSHPQARFKVDINAQENRLTGCAIISEGISVVIVEGGAKSIKRYGKLMLRRIDWSAAVKKEDEEEDDDEDKPLNKCVLVWQGSVAKPSFTRFSVQECRTETAARKFFSDHGVGHYWDLAVNFTEDDPI
ncbi:UNVERIFIED_CONTAM: Protein RDM16 [Sesamum indicum]